MEKKFTPNEMLDITLNWFAMDFKDIGMGEDAIPRNEVEHHTAERLIMRMHPQLDKAGSEFMEYSNMILEQLVSDRYLSKIGPRYSITFKGKMFSKSGGYIKKEKRESTSITLQSWQTWAISVGTVLAGIYGLVEILKPLIGY